MTFLPILRRELIVAARRTVTYRQRVVFAAAATATVAMLILVSSLTRFSGATIFLITARAGFLLCLLEGLRVAADTIAWERREGTLGLLLLTDARGVDVVAGKIAAAAIQSLTTVVSMIPAFSLPLLMGGVTAGECWRVILMLLASLFLSLSAGMFVSSITTSTLAAFATSLVVVLAVLAPSIASTLVPGIPALDRLQWISGPLPMLMRGPESAFLQGVGQFWAATAGSVLVCLLLFVAAGVLLHRFPRLDVVQEDSLFQRLLRPRPGRSVGWGGASARMSPAVWLAERTLPGRQALWILVSAGGIIACIAGVVGGRTAIEITFGCEVFFAFLIMLWLAAVAPLSLSASRRGGALELLLCTPLTPRELVRGQVDSLYSYFLGPALMVSVGFTIITVISMSLAQNGAGLHRDGGAFAFGLFWFILFLLDLHALAYTGLWFGLTNARVDRAVAKTVVAVLVVQCLTFIIPPLGCLGLIGWPIFWISWSSSRLEGRFRLEAVKQLSLADDSGWLPWR